MENTPSTTCAESRLRPAGKRPWPSIEDARIGVERLVAHCDGDTKQAAKLAGVATSTLYRWRARLAGGGNGGKIPFSRIPKILMRARKARLALSLSDLTDEVS